MAIPTLLELAVDGSSVAIRFSEALSATLPSINRFAVLVNGRRVYASSAAATLSNGGTTIGFSLRSAVAPGATVALTYTSVNGADKPGFGDIRSASTNDRAAFFRASTTANLSGTSTTPTVAITSSTAALIAGQTSTITFTFSRDPGASFSNDDISLAGGTLSTITGTGLTRTATFTPTAASSGTASITVAAGTYTDVFGNSGSAGTTPALSYDTLRPTVTITDSNPNTVNIADGTVTVTFTFSEAVTGFSTSNVSVGNGSKGTFTAVSSTVYTLVVTPTAASSGNITVDVITTGVTDAAGNVATAPAQYIQAFDTLAPTVSSVVNPASAQYVLAGGTLSLTLNFSETVKLSNAGTATITAIVDLAAGGTANVTLTATGTTTTAAGVSQLTFSNNSLPTTLTDTNGVLVTANSLSIISGTFTDNAGNSVSSTFSQLSATNQLVDTVVPTLAITTPISTDGYLNNAEDESSLIISGTSSGADGRTVTVVVGSITGQTATIATGGAWSITLTSAQVKILTEGTVNITANVSDTAGNPATQATASFVYDITAPTLAITSYPAAVLAGDIATITFTFSETPAGFTASDIITSGGSITGLVAVSDDRKVYTATFYADETGTASLSVAAGSYTDLAGNAGGAAFYAAADPLAISSLGSGDVLAVAEGATANAAISAIGFTATSQTSNAGAATLTSMGYAVNLANATGPNGYAVTNTGAATTFIGSAFNDTLTGGAGNDTFVGGAGDDTYNVDSTTDTITEDLDAGTDTIESSVAFSLAAIANVENLTFTGSTAVNGTGNALNNVITGNEGNNTLNGGAGNDTLVGGAGNDTLSGGAGIDILVGGAGDDIYIVDSTSETIIEDLINAGTDTIQSSVTFSLAAIENVENLTLTGTAVNGTGNALNNVITGNEGNNTLNGGAGTDTLIGGAGDDIYSVDSTTDTITEDLNAGTDTIQSSVTLTMANIANVENLTLTGSSAINGTGNALNNVITGNGGNNSLTGGDGNDTLNGGAGTDTLVGGAGDDIYSVDSTTDTITEALNAGTDTIQSSVTLTMANIANVENLTLTGSSAINGTGNALNNVITGNGGNNTLNGNAGTDTVVGGAGNDTLTGSVGNDILTGGSGNDTFTVDFDIDTITDLGNGSDTLRVYGTANATVTAAFTAGLGTSNAGTATLTSAGFTVNLSGASNGLGTNGYSVTNTGAGATFTGSTYNDSLTGGTGNDTLNGGNGNDSLTGRTGIDTLTGGVGVDIFIFAAGDAVISGTTSPSFERITDLLIGTDTIDGPNAVVAASVQHIVNVVASLTSDSITALLTTTNFLASGASTFTFGSGAGLRTFIALNDATAGYSSTLDGIIEITGYTGTLTSLSII